VKTIEVRIPHSLSPAEVKQRLDRALVHARDEYAEKVGQIEATWEGDDKLAVDLAVMGMQIAGDVLIQPGEVVVSVQVPGMAGLFAGRIREGVQERLGGLLGSSPA